jgi:hypothetical protein
VHGLLRELVGPVETGDHALALVVQVGNGDLERFVVVFAFAVPALQHGEVVLVSVPGIEADLIQGY